MATTTNNIPDDFSLEISQEIINLTHDLSIPSLVLFYDKARTRLFALLKALSIYERVRYHIDKKLDDRETVDNVEHFLLKRQYTLHTKDETAIQLLSYLHILEGEENGQEQKAS